MRTTAYNKTTAMPARLTATRYFNTAAAPSDAIETVSIIGTGTDSGKYTDTG